MNDNSSQLRIGIILNYVNLALSGIIPLLYTPIMLRILGQHEYGLYKLSGSITSYLGLISFGLGAAITRYLIKARTEHGIEEECKVLGLFVKIFRWISAIAFFIGIILSLFIDLWYSDSLSADDLFRMRILVVLLAANTAINFYAAPYISIVNAYERFLFLQTMAILSTCLGPILNLIALFLGYASIGLAVSSLFATIVFRIGFYIYVERTMVIKPIYTKMPKTYIKDLLSFSFWVFVSNVVGQLYDATDTVMIGAVPALGTAAVAVYNIGVTFNGMIFSINAGISSMLVPKANKMVFSGASSFELTDTAIRFGRIQAIIISLFVFGFITFGREFIHFYAGDNYAVSYWIALVCMIPNTIPLVQSFFLNVLIARNKNRFRAMTYLLMAILNVIVTWYALKVLGVLGAALATSFSFIIGHGFIMNWYYKTHLKLHIFKFWKELVQVYAPIILLSTVFIFLGNVVDYYSLPVLLCFILLFILCFIVVQWIWVMNDYEKGIILNILPKKK